MKIISKIHHMARLINEKLIYFGGVSEYIAVKWLLRIYQSKYRLDWMLGKDIPHFYNHRMGMAHFAFGKTSTGPYAYLRGFFASQIIQEADLLLDIGCGDGFFTKRFFSAKCKHVDAIDIEPSAIDCARRENGAENIKYHQMDAVKSDFPGAAYNVIVWDGAIGHFSPDTLEIMLRKIVNALSQYGVFVGSEFLGDEGSDHITRFYSPDDFGKLFLKYFKFVEVSTQDYRINDSEYIRHEAYWRCANEPDRLKKMNWNKYHESRNL